MVSSSQTVLSSDEAVFPEAQQFLGTVGELGKGSELFFTQNDQIT